MIRPKSDDLQAWKDYALYVEDEATAQRKFAEELLTRVGDWKAIEKEVAQLKAIIADRVYDLNAYRQ